LEIFKDKIHVNYTSITSNTSVKAYRSALTDRERATKTVSRYTENFDI